MKLTDQRIRSLTLTEKGQRYCSDDAIPGLAVCVGTRTKSFTLAIRRGDKRKRHTLGPYDPPRFTLAMAREKARDILVASGWVKPRRRLPPLKKRSRRITASICLNCEKKRNAS